jgi:hypothetical protein
VTIHALLECLPLEHVLEVHLALFVALAFDGDAPRFGLEALRVALGIVFVDAELVEVVVAGDVLPRVDLLARQRIRALLHVLELSPVRRPLRLGDAFGAENAGGRCRARDSGGAQKVASVQV